MVKDAKEALHVIQSMYVGTENDPGIVLKTFEGIVEEVSQREDASSIEVMHIVLSYAQLIKNIVKKTVDIKDIQKDYGV